MSNITRYKITPSLDTILPSFKLQYTDDEKKIIELCKKSNVSAPKELECESRLISIIEMLRKKMKNERFCIGLTDEDGYEDWENLENDMKHLSVQIPDTMIQLLVIYEQGYHEDCKLIYFMDGKMQIAAREPFDKAKLK